MQVTQVFPWKTQVLILFSSEFFCHCGLEWWGNIGTINGMILQFFFWGFWFPVNFPLIAENLTLNSKEAFKINLIKIRSLHLLYFLFVWLLHLKFNWKDLDFKQVCLTGENVLDFCYEILVFTLHEKMDLGFCYKIVVLSYHIK